jgi:hypothetical protein
MQAAGQGILVLGSQRRVVDLLDKKAAIYSDRPAFPIVDMYVVYLRLTTPY